MAKHKYRKRLRKGNCVYCGSYSEELSAEDVIPKCLFSGYPPSDTPIVYACKPCNNEIKSKGDGYLRDYLVRDLERAERSVTPSLQEAFERSKEKKHSQFARDISYRYVPSVTPNGLFCGFALAEIIPSEPMKSILRTTVRGLYHAYTGKWLPKQIQAEVFRIADPALITSQIQDLSQKGGKYVAVGDGKVFECLYGFARELPTESIWWLSFNRHSVFCVGTNREHLLTGLASI